MTPREEASGMESLVWVLAGGAATYAAWWLRTVRVRRSLRAAELAGVRRAAEEDVAILGEQLRRLDHEVSGRPLDVAGQEDYQRALDAYERSAREAARLHDPAAVGELAETISESRHAMACVQARAAQRPRPEPTPACFFNPRHGLSVTRVQWTPPKRATRMLPACRQCAARLAAGGPLDVRTVTVGSRTVPYWEVCAHHLPYRDDATAPRVSATGPRVRWIWDTAMSGDVDLGHYVGEGRHSGPPRADA